MLISTLSYYTTELYKEFAAYTTEKLHELGLNFGQMYFIIYVTFRTAKTGTQSASD